MMMSLFLIKKLNDFFRYGGNQVLQLCNRATIRVLQQSEIIILGWVIFQQIFGTKNSISN